MTETDTGKREQWATVSEAAAILNRSERTIRRWITAGKVAVDRTGPTIRIDIARLVPVGAATARGMPLHAEIVGEADLLKAELERLREQLEDTRAERDRLWQALADSQALARALVPERRQLTAGQARSWWRRLLGTD